MRTHPGYDQEKTQGIEADESRVPFDVQQKMREEREKFYAARNECQAARPMSEAEILAELFSYHPPRVDTLPKFAAINQAAKNFAEIILQNCPPSSDRSDAIRKIRDARMTANAAIALNGLSL